MFYYSDKKYSNNDKFRKFRRQPFHTSLAFMLQDIWPGMTSPEVAQYPDQHLRQVIFGPYIADYPEQALLACIVQGWCLRCTVLPTNLDGESKRRSEEHTEVLVNCLDLGVLWDEYGIVGDLVLIKGTFKDHLVTWVEEYITQNYSSACANKILDDIDQRLANEHCDPSFSLFSLLVHVVRQTTPINLSYQLALAEGFGTPKPEQRGDD
ncbi:hypothetical protein SERLA73DRAFT_149286 [Serpula lacrymans var. lacrymans S7.3]|uniref:Uncharacterized protein n=1 Tax=Serpula lacrymans var. lacrymans (strain S7.3) TaxID=936435 RepID=F8PHE5_SERL3|nr:hypothetical protein SERLA73DRAFT_149286 [Serpula lacrymans var. lacrymans S7.3]